MNEYYENYQKQLVQNSLDAAALNARHMLELLVRYYVQVYIPEYINDSVFDQINELKDRDLLNKHQVKVLHAVRKTVNSGAHIGEKELTMEDMNTITAMLPEIIDMYETVA